MHMFISGEQFVTPNKMYFRRYRVQKGKRNKEMSTNGDIYEVGAIETGSAITFSDSAPKEALYQISLADCPWFS